MEELLKLIRPGEQRVRIAPSPTGPFHLGNARCALFNYLFAKKFQGKFILRIDDTDTARSQKVWEEEIFESLNWLKLEWDEGPKKGGPFAPYRQSERKEIYKKYIEKLFQEEKIYYCFCSKEELKAQRQYLLSIGQAPRYSGKCRNLTKAEIEKNLREKKEFVLRLKVPKKIVEFQDFLRGKIKYPTESFGDIVVAKDFQTPLYNLASVIDDYEMKITLVIRGEDHLPNTPKQILIAQALEIEHPNYLHLPLILGPDRAKLSSRHGAKSIKEYKKEGYLPEAIINFLALLGWNPGDNREIFSLENLIKEFSLEKLQKSPAIFNQKKLLWLNGFYIRKKSIDELTKECLPYLIKEGLIKPEVFPRRYPCSFGAEFFETEFFIPETKEKITFYQLEKIISIYQERLKVLGEIPQLVDFFFKKELSYQKELLTWKGASFEKIKKALKIAKKILEKIKEKEWKKENLEKILIKSAEEFGEGDRGYLLWPLRVALTGKKASAPPFEIAEILGKKKTLKRIKKAISKL